ncbi:MAG: VPLPA-CTERM sorting domain-containing protein [Nitrospirales bacterium]|nr:VPLPA-CTERM sorting domain-containing protein [Nitrospirales bacterium]
MRKVAMWGVVLTWISVLTLMAFAQASMAAPLVNGLGGPAGFGENSLAANDDGSTGFLDLSALFPGGLNFFGTTYTGLYLNNNGNVTFKFPLSTYTPSALTGATQNPIIAPFFADVDTRRGPILARTPGGTSTGSNLLHYDFDPEMNTFTATWDDVCYVAPHVDKLNAFQLSLVNRYDTGVGNFDILFHYEDINWTTGDFSGGSGGLGGDVARAGWNSGNGTDFYELPQSGVEAQILALEGASNIGVPGVYLFAVRGGQVIQPVPESRTFLLVGGGLLGVWFLRKMSRRA